MADLERREFIRTAAMGVLAMAAPGVAAQSGKERVILGARPLGFQWETSDPFLFCVHHDDRYPAGNDAMGPAASLQGRDIGQDFKMRDGWRMYHGEKVPGFPGHPHRGFETVTIVRPISRCYGAKTFPF